MSPCGGFIEKDDLIRILGSRLFIKKTVPFTGPTVPCMQTPVSKHKVQELPGLQPFDNEELIGQSTSLLTLALWIAHVME